MSAPALRSWLCPDDFCPAPPPPSPALDALRRPEAELWLIRTPADFSPASLNGCKVPLVGFQTLKSHRDEAGVRRRHHILSSTTTGPETLLAPSAGAGSQLVPAPALQGTLSVLDVPRTKSSGQTLHAIPTSPPPQIPPGLRPRFQAFGGRQPVLGSPTQASVGVAGEAKSARKRKKPELLSQNPSPLEVPNGVAGLSPAPGRERPEPLEPRPVKGDEELAVPSPAKKKKKKRKKELEEEMPEPAGGGPGPAGGAPGPTGGVPEVAVELQPEAVISPTKTKKSKRRREPTGELLEPAGGAPEPQQEAVLPLKTKKSKKRRESEGKTMKPAGGGPEPAGEMMEPGERRLEPQSHIDLQEQKAPTSAKKKSRKKLEARAEMLVPEQVVGLEGKEGTDPHPTKRKKEEAGEMPTSLGEVEPSHAKRKKKKKKKRKSKEGEGVAPELPEGMESLAGVPEPVASSPSQGVEKKKKKKRLHPGEVGPVEA